MTSTRRRAPRARDAAGPLRRRPDGGAPRVYNLAINRLDSGDLAGPTHASRRASRTPSARASRSPSTASSRSTCCSRHSSSPASGTRRWRTHARVRDRVPAAQRDWLQVPHPSRDRRARPAAVLPLGAHLSPLAEPEPGLAPGHGADADAQRWLGDGEAATTTGPPHRRTEGRGRDEWGLGQLQALGIGLGGLADAAAAAAPSARTTATVARLRSEGDGLRRARASGGPARPAATCHRSARRAAPGWPGRGGMVAPGGQGRRRTSGSGPSRSSGSAQVYEVARSRRHLAEALLAQGDRSGARPRRPDGAGDGGGPAGAPAAGGDRRARPPAHGSTSAAVPAASVRASPRGSRRSCGWWRRG